MIPSGGLFNKLTTPALTGSKIMKDVATGLSTPNTKTNNNPVFNQNVNFGAITIVPVTAGASISLLGGGGGGTPPEIKVSQAYSPTTNVTNKTSNSFMTTYTTTNTYSPSFSNPITNITGSPNATVNTPFTPTTTVMPTVTPTQTISQTDTTKQQPSIVDSLTGVSGASWWQYLIIGGVAIVGIYLISNAFKGRKKGNKRDLAYRVAKYG